MMPIYHIPDTHDATQEARKQAWLEERCKLYAAIMFSPDSKREEKFTVNPTPDTAKELIQRFFSPEGNPYKVTWFEILTGLRAFAPPSSESNPAATVFREFATPEPFWREMFVGEDLVAAQAATAREFVKVTVKAGTEGRLLKVSPVLNWCALNYINQIFNVNCLTKDPMPQAPAVKIFLDCFNEYYGLSLDWTELKALYAKYPNPRDIDWIAAPVWKVVLGKMVESQGELVGQIFPSGDFEVPGLKIIDTNPLSGQPTDLYHLLLLAAGLNIKINLFEKQADEQYAPPAILQPEFDLKVGEASATEYLAFSGGHYDRIVVIDENNEDALARAVRHNVYDRLEQVHRAQFAMYLHDGARPLINEGDLQYTKAVVQAAGNAIIEARPPVLSPAPSVLPALPEVEEEKDEQPAAVRVKSEALPLSDGFVRYRKPFKPLSEKDRHDARALEETLLEHDEEDEAEQKTEETVASSVTSDGNDEEEPVANEHAPLLTPTLSAASSGGDRNDPQLVPLPGDAEEQEPHDEEDLPAEVVDDQVPDAKEEPAAAPAEVAAVAQQPPPNEEDDEEEEDEEDEEEEEDEENEDDEEDEEEHHVAVPLQPVAVAPVAEEPNLAHTPLPVNAAGISMVSDFNTRQTVVESTALRNWLTQLSNPESNEAAWQEVMPSYHSALHGGGASAPVCRADDFKQVPISGSETAVQAKIIIDNKPVQLLVREKEITVDVVSDESIRLAFIALKKMRGANASFTTLPNNDAAIQQRVYDIGISLGLTYKPNTSVATTTSSMFAPARMPSPTVLPANGGPHHHSRNSSRRY